MFVVFLGLGRRFDIFSTSTVLFGLFI